MSDPNRAPERHEHAPAAPRPAERTDPRAATDVMLHQAETAGAMAEVLGSVESAESAEGEKGFGETEDQSKGKQGGAAATDPAAVVLPVVQPLPLPVVMKKEIAAEIRKEIRTQEKEILLAYVGIRKMSPDKLAEVVSQLRQLKELLASLVEATTEYLKSLYAKWVLKEVA